jgi:hypothetical protein
MSRTDLTVWRVEMTDESVERRMLLRGAGLAGAAVLGGTALASPASARDRKHDHNGDHDNDATGAWMIHHRDDPPGDTTNVLAVVGLAEGGVVTVQDLAPLGAAALGAWKSRDNGRFKANFWTGAPSSGADEPAVVVNVRVRGRARHDKISGTYSFTALDAADMKELFKGTGTFEGERIEA